MPCQNRVLDRESVSVKPCPFCGCSMQVEYKHYPNGTGDFEPFGWHDDDCPLSEVLWCLEQDEGWTKDRVVEGWNRRVGDGDA